MVMARLPSIVMVAGVLLSATSLLAAEGASASQAATQSSYDPWTVGKVDLDRADVIYSDAIPTPHRKWAKPYYQIVVNAAGVVYDSREQDASWNGDLSVAVGREAGGWTVELAVPWASLGAERPKAGAKIRVLVARNRRAAGASELSLWPFISGGNHQPNLFAEGVLKAGGPG